MKLIMQYSVDILIDDEDPMDCDIDEEEIARALEETGYVVVGSAWKATWDEDGYKTGTPLSSD